MADPGSKTSRPRKQDMADPGSKTRTPRKQEARGLRVRVREYLDLYLFDSSSDRKD